MKKMHCSESTSSVFVRLSVFVFSAVMQVRACDCGSELSPA